MKQAIDLNGNTIEVSDDTTVKTVNGIHYLLTPEEEAEFAARNAAWAEGATVRHNANATRNRAAAYAAEADPLYFKAQRGEVTELEWLDKVMEIKTRFPKI